MKTEPDSVVLSNFLITAERLEKLKKAHKAYTQNPTAFFNIEDVTFNMEFFPYGSRDVEKACELLAEQILYQAIVTVQQELNERKKQVQNYIDEIEQLLNDHT